MRINFRCLLLLLIAFMMQAVAFAGSIEAPQLRQGRFVYTLPNNFDPPLIGRSGIEDIEQAAEKLHYPFYVVVAQSFNGSSTEDLSDAMDGLASSWSRDPLFNRAESSIIILTYQPRKFRILAASKWRAKYALEGSGSDRFTEIFTQYAKGSAKDPATGIIESMKALDDYVFEQNDPKRIAARVEAARKAEAQRALQVAASTLDNQINRMEVLLSQTSFLPTDTTPYRNALAKAKQARDASSAAEMLPAASALKSAAGRLDDAMSPAREANRREMAEQQRAAAEKERLAEEAEHRAELLAVQQTVLGVVLAIGLFLFVFLRRRKLMVLREKFKAQLDYWEEPLRNAAENHVRFFEERMAVTELETTTGRTKEKYDEITREIGTVYPKIEAMRERIERSKELFASGSFFKLQPLQKALSLLDADFEFDTETLNRKALFEPPARMMQVKPTELRSQAEQLYSENITDWDELMQALKLRGTIAQDAFPQNRLTAMLAQADANNIPHGYFSSHPLFGAGDTDARFYDDLNSFRISDPLLYKERLDEQEKVQAELEALLSRLIAAIGLVASKRIKTLPVYGDTVVAPEDDPALTLQQANRADEQMAGFVAAQKEIEVVEKAAATTAELYTKAVEQAGAIQAAIANIKADIAALQAHQKMAEALFDQAKIRLQQTLQIHSNTATVATSLAAGRDYIGRAIHFADKTERLLNEKRHLDARKTAQEAERHLSLAEGEFDQCIQGCEQLDAVKAQYERQAAIVDAARDQAQASIRRYDSGVRLRDFDVPRFAGPVDYALQIAQINAYRQEIETTARNVRQAYEEEQARIAREAEQERQAEAARQRSESSSGSWSSSSSSGSSWSSSSSSSSSGSDWGSSSSSNSSSSSGSDW